MVKTWGGQQTVIALRTRSWSNAYIQLERDEPSFCYFNHNRQANRQHCDHVLGFCGLSQLEITPQSQFANSIEVALFPSCSSCKVVRCADIVLHRMSQHGFIACNNWGQMKPASQPFTDWAILGNMYKMNKLGSRLVNCCLECCLFFVYLFWVTCYLLDSSSLFFGGRNIQ